jgi:tetratricopeptide (TPR) repeat protein
MDPSRLKKAEAYLHAGKLDRAEKELRKILNKNSKTLQAWLMLASIYGQTGRFNDVASAAKKAITINSDHPMAHSLLGSAYVVTGNINAAIASLETANRLLPGDAGILSNLGNAYYTAEKFSEAERCYQNALNVDANYHQSNFGMGNCCLSKSLWKEAVQYFKKAYGVMPEDYNINMSLGKAYVNLACIDEAYKYIERATRLQGPPSTAFYELGHLAQLQGNLDKAKELIEKSLKHDANNTHALSERVEINYKLGHYDLAHEQIKDILSNGVVSPAVVISWGKICQKFGECDEVIDNSHAIMKDTPMSKSDRMMLHYLLGSLYDKKNQFYDASEQYQHANAVFPAQYDRIQSAGMADSLIRNFSSTPIESMPHSQCDDQRPVFIVGMPRSGSSLIEQILSSHPLVHGAGELNDVAQLVGTLFTSSQHQENTIFSNVLSSQLNTLADHYLKRLESKCGSAKRVTDKMPSNFLWVGFIKQLFPNARIIHCIRDPRDTCLSCYFQSFVRSHDYANDLADLAFYYRQYEKLMLFWRQIFDKSILDVHYSDLVANTEATARQMVDFIGLEWDDNCLNYHQSERVTATASWDQVRQPIYSKSIARWKNYQQYIEPLIDEFGSDDVAISLDLTTSIK